ncbi:MAG: hypothetical protein M1591_04530, partial [Deltaproteobacteria bacterium]|nr:hypothetical protein [Deltaproteobacteria bacterium]
MKYLFYPVMVLIMTVVSCTTSNNQSPNILTANTESQIRSFLNIPVNAQQVMIVSQSSHWDPDWQSTFDTYYTNNVDP